MNNARTQVNTLRVWHEATVFSMMALVAVIALALYIAFIGKTIFTLVDEKRLETENRALSAEISELELRTLAQNDALSIEKAYAMGFVSAKSAEYVAPALTLSQR